MILDTVLEENAVMESLTEAQEEYVVDAYAAGYIAALEQYIKNIEEEHKALPKEVVVQLKDRAQKRLDKTREALRQTKEHRKVRGINASDTKEGKAYNNAHRHVMRINDEIHRMNKKTA